MKKLIVLLFAYISLAVTSCQKRGNHPDVKLAHIGCMDKNATNYDSAANTIGTCHYTIEALTGTYAVVDSYFYLKQTGLTSFVPDTVIKLDTIIVSLVSYDSLSFNKLIEHSSPVSTHFKINMSDSTFSYYKGDEYISTSALGTLAGNQLKYSTSTLYCYSSRDNKSRHIKGYKIN